MVGHRHNETNNLQIIIDDIKYHQSLFAVILNIINHYLQIIRFIMTMTDHKVLIL